MVYKILPRKDTFNYFYVLPCILIMGYFLLFNSFNFLPLKTPLFLFLTQYTSLFELKNITTGVFSVFFIMCRGYLFSLHLYYFIGLLTIITLYFFFYFFFFWDFCALKQRYYLILSYIYLVFFYFVAYLLMCTVTANHYSQNINEQLNYAPIHTLTAVFTYFTVYFFFVTILYLETKIFTLIYVYVYNYFFFTLVGLVFGCFWTFFNDYLFIFWNWDFIEIFFLDYIFWWFIFYHFFLISSKPIICLLLCITNVMYFRFSTLTSSHHILQTNKFLFAPCTKSNCGLSDMGVLLIEYKIIVLLSLYHLFKFYVINIFLIFRLHYSTFFVYNFLIYIFYFYFIFSLCIYYLLSISLFFFNANTPVITYYCFLFYVTLFSMLQHPISLIPGVISVILYFFFKLPLVFTMLLFKFLTLFIFFFILHVGAFFMLLFIFNAFLIFKNILFLRINTIIPACALIDYEGNPQELLFSYVFNSQKSIANLSTNFFIFNTTLIFIWVLKLYKSNLPFSNKIFLLKFYFVC